MVVGHLLPSYAPGRFQLVSLLLNVLGLLVDFFELAAKGCQVFLLQRHRVFSMVRLELVAFEDGFHSVARVHEHVLNVWLHSMANLDRSDWRCPTNLTLGFGGGAHTGLAEDMPAIGEEKTVSVAIIRLYSTAVAVHPRFHPARFTIFFNWLRVPKIITF